MILKMIIRLMWVCILMDFIRRVLGWMRILLGVSWVGICWGGLALWVWCRLSSLFLFFRFMLVAFDV
jgi:hypothetical protein